MTVAVGVAEFVVLMIFAYAVLILSAVVAVDVLVAVVAYRVLS